MKRIKCIFLVLCLFMCLIGCKHDEQSTSITIHDLGLDGWSQENSTE